jgi:hypothetical protein
MKNKFFKIQNIKTFSLVILLSLTVSSLMQGQNQKIDFSGKWVYNASKSNNGPQAASPAGSRSMAPAGEMTVTQQENLMLVKTSIKGQDGNPVERELKYTLDFKPTVNINPGRNGGEGTPSKSYARWSDDGKTLRIVTTTVGNGSTKITEEWALLNAATLAKTTINRAATGNEVKTVAVYIKK